MRTKIELYLDNIDRTDNTKHTYKWALDYFVDTVGENAELNIKTYEQFHRAIKNHSPSTKRVLASAVVGLYNFHDLADPAKIKKINNIYIRKEKGKPVVFDREAVEKILRYCENLTGSLIELRDRAFFITLADSGFRISELCGLRRGDIDWNNQRVMVTGKGEKVAPVRLSIRSINALKDYLVARAEMDGGSGKSLETLPLFIQHSCTKKIKRITSDGMRKSLKLIMNRVGVNVRVHDFRHYFVTVVMIASGGNLKLAQELARHESTSTTQRYAHFADTELDQKYDEIFNEA